MPTRRRRARNSDDAQGHQHRQQQSQVRATHLSPQGDDGSASPYTSQHTPTYPVSTALIMGEGTNLPGRSDRAAGGVGRFRRTGRIGQIRIRAGYGIRRVRVEGSRLYGENHAPVMPIFSHEPFLYHSSNVASTNLSGRRFVSLLQRVLGRRCAMPYPQAATPLSAPRARGTTNALALRPADLFLVAGAFCIGFALERLFRPFRKPVVVFFRHPVPYPHQPKKPAVPAPRQLA